MDPELRAAIAARLGGAVVGARAIGGGSINEAWALELADGSSVFAKTHRDAPADMFAAEVHGLAFLREGLRGVEGLRAPAVIACEREFLVLELIEPGPARADFDELLGRGLASLHRSGAGLGLGLERDNFIGSLPQSNEPRPDWPSFYRDCRLAPMLARAGSRISSALRRRFDRLLAWLPELCGPPEPPARLHGDLWSGNLHRDAGGRPVLIDPAVYVGHREIDLAMMRLFGGFSARTFAAYAEAWPLAQGWERRVDLYQLYPLLVHVVLFGGGYVGSLEAALRRLE
ncbi:MAG: fructosamine kinase family protein [Enhygromyxa sp.]